MEALRARRSGEGPVRQLGSQRVLACWRPPGGPLHGRWKLQHYATAVLEAGLLGQASKLV